MKRIILYITLLANIGIITISCNDFLDKEPDDAVTMEIIFNDKTRTTEWLAGLYSIIPDALWHYTRDWSVIPITDDCQIAIAMAAYGDPWKYSITNNQGGMNPTFVDPSSIWQNCYQKIRGAHLFLENVKALPSQGLTSSDVQQMKMEARFVIAYCYTKLLELYGPVPYVDRLYSSDESTDNMALPRQPYDQMVVWLDQEYKELADFFPASYTNPATMYGHANKGACLALRARLLLYAASPLFNGNEDYADVVNKDGTPLFSQNKDIKKWKKAADATRELLDLAETGVYSLYKEYYSNGNIDPFLSFQNLFLKTGGDNKEILFGTAYKNYQWYNRIGNPRGFAGSAGYFGLTQNLVDAFYMKDGTIPITGYNADNSPIINQLSNYAESNFTTADIKYNNTSYNLNSGYANKSKLGVITESGTFEMYANREPRFYITLWFDNEYIPLGARKTNFKSGGLDGGPTHDSPQCGYLIRKGINPESNPQKNTYQMQPGILLRLAEFYLNYAEALNEYNYSGNKTEIVKYLNMVRERAGIPTFGTEAGQIAIPTDQDAMREVIRRERRVEFAAEGDVRYNDVRRWKIAENIFKIPIMGMDRTKSDNSFYKRTEYMSRKFEKKNYLRPIYQTHMDNNPNLIQNKFW